MKIAHPCVFIGYPFGQKAYKVLNLVTKQIFISRDVKIVEHIFPFYSLHSITFQNTSYIPNIVQNIHTYEFSEFSHFTPSMNSPNSSKIPTKHPSEPLPNPHINVQPFRRTTIYRHPLMRLNDYICQNVISEESNFSCHHTLTNLYICDNVSNTKSLFLIPYLCFVCYCSSTGARFLS